VSEARTDSGLRLIPAAFAMLDIDNDPAGRAAAVRAPHECARRRLAAPPPSIDELKQRGWREITGDGFQRRARGDDPDEAA
jgi:hypothetical protein